MTAPAAPAPPADARHNISTLLVDDVIARHGADAPAARWDGGAWSFGELAEHVASAAVWWRDAGRRRGDTVLMALDDGPEWLALFLGAQRLGIVCALAGPSLPIERLRDAAARLAPTLIVAETSLSRRNRAADPQEAFAAVAESSPAIAPEPVRRDDAAYLLLTSGSTGPSKWAVHTAGHMASCIATFGRRVLRLHPGDVTWSVAALPTSYGLGNSCYFPLAAGACASLATRDRSPAAAAAACRRDGVTVMLGVPTAWARLARHVEEGRVAREDFAGIRLAVSAGEDLPAVVWERVAATTGMRLVNALGSSELTNLYLSDRAGAPSPGTVGWVVPGYEVRIGDGSAPLDEGELWVRGPTTMSGYLGQSGGPGRDGWMPTGDVVRRAPDGRHAFRGRVNDRFKSSGLWIEPDRVRAALESQPGVRRAVVMPVTDADGLDRVGAALETGSDPDEGLTARALDAARRMLRPSEVPRALIGFAEFPVAVSGKVDRNEIRQRLTEALIHTPHEERA